MMNPDEFGKEDLNKILSRLDMLEERLELLELNKEQFRRVQTLREREAEEEDSKFIDVDFSLSAPFESKLGEYGLAWLGNIVLFFAIALMWQYFNDAGKPLISCIVGVVSVAGVFIMSHYFRKSFTYLSFMFNLFGFIILYYIILRLHYYNAKPFFTNEVITVVLLLAVVGIQLYFAVVKKSQVLAAQAFTLAMVTAFVYSQIHAFFLISLATTALGLYAFWKFNWWKSMIFILCISFFFHLVWLLKNPVSLITSPADLTYFYSYIYFSAITALYSLMVFRKPDKAYPENIVLTTILLAGIAYSVYLLALVFLHYPTKYVQFFTSISVYCIAYSVILKFYSPWKYSPALYALFGFVAISVTIFGIYHFPDAFLLLICQSFLVLALALWYRSQIITLMNTFLMVSLVVLYYNLSGNLQVVNFSIPIVAFLSARIIKWQSERLNIKTEFIRNIYLFTLFFSLLIATYKGLPGQYITVSWLCIAGIYFGLSIIIKSIKYRWMAMANLLVSAFYLFLVDLAKIDLVFRILAFLVFAVISIVISTYYVRKLKQKGNDDAVEAETKN